MVLEEYATLFAYCGTVCMLPFFICPLVACRNIIKYGFSDFLPPNTFLNGLTSSILWYLHGKLIWSKEMMQQNLFGIALQIIYLTVYYYYLKFKAPFHETAIKFAIFIVVLLIYVHWESPLLAPQRFGYILTLLNLSSLIPPIMSVIHVVMTKNSYANGMPYIIVFFGQVVTTFWLLFAISINNYVFMLQMLVPFILGAIQIILYFVYPPTALCVVSFTMETEYNNLPLNFGKVNAIKDRRHRLSDLKRRNTSVIRYEISPNIN